MARQVIETGLKKPTARNSWAIASNGILHSVHVPICPDGSIENGDAKQQTEVALADLQAALKAAGAGIEDITLVQIYLASLKYKSTVDEVYKRFFSEP